MPYFRGIEISIIASNDAKKLPEHPHPDGSSVRLRRLTAATAGHQDNTGLNPTSSSPTTSEPYDPTLEKKENPRVSVYISSLPGEQFWLRYVIAQSPAPSKCIFFKMIMNGRHITSWGIDTTCRTAGNVMRALYEPGGGPGGMSDPDGSTYPGIETRYFHFTAGLGHLSAAEDGGLIEVQVFRSKGRKRVAPMLGTYRSQDKFGITSPSGGLVDNPQDATYYNYYLLDAKDEPYATFLFHYRSMKWLQQLNLIPQRGLSPVPAPLSPVTNARSREVSAAKTISPRSQPFDFYNHSNQSSPNVDIAHDDGIKQLFGRKAREHPESVFEDHFQENLVDSSPAGSLDALTYAVPKREQRLGSLQLYRPLPEIPPRSLSRPSSTSSLRSNCPSLTPSLARYVESDDFENEEIRLGTAQPLVISPSMQALELGGDKENDENSGSDYADSPGSAGTNHSSKLPSPEGYIATTGSTLQRHMDQFDSPAGFSTPTRGRSKTKGQLEPSSSTHSMTEAEWLKHTPSPPCQLRRVAPRLWSPRPGSKSPRSSRDMGSESFNNTDMRTQVQGEASTQRGSYEDVEDTESARSPVGNWI
ncbi:hypothetical protein F5Y18DRAFT_162584 [Xylariaceae sp. FL1019]|nr:hypothetical protein F5Y18DRAFT_162584 [Xylariaceae sp. FL1019]